MTDCIYPVLEHEIPDHGGFKAFIGRRLEEWEHPNCSEVDI